MEKKTQAMEATEPAETAMEPKTLDTKDKLFTQDEVDEIVQCCLAKERERLTSGGENTEIEQKLAEREQAVLQRELRADAIDRLKHDGYPQKLVDLIPCDNAEMFEDRYKAVVKVYNDIKNDFVPKAPIKAGAYEQEKPTYKDPLQEVFSPKNRKG